MAQLPGLWICAHRLRCVRDDFLGKPWRGLAKKSTLRIQVLLFKSRKGRLDGQGEDHKSHKEMKHTK